MSTSSTLQNIAEPNTPLIIISLSHVLKLTSMNYVSWCTQMNASLVGYGLDGFVDGTLKVPDLIIPATVAAANIPATPAKPNPAYETYRRQDQLLYSALAGTLSSSIVPLISRCKTSREAWQILAKTFANPSKGHIRQVKERLRGITKGNRTITEYMCDIKTAADQLATLGKALDDDEIVEYVVEQLRDPDYEAVTNGILNRETSISFDELNEKLVNREATILQQRSQPAHSAPITAHYVQKQSLRKPYTHSQPTQYSAPPQHDLPRPNHEPNRNSCDPNRSTKPYNGRCQWCRQHGHYVSQCPVFRQQFPNAAPPSNPPTSRQGNRTAPSLYAPKAYTASAPHQNPNGWLLDSGASHHITNDLDNLSLHGPYGGSDELIIGDGSGLSIANTGLTLGEDNISRTQ